MSAALLDDKLLPEQEFRRFLSSHPEIVEDVEKEKTISHKFDMPYGAGYSLTGNRIYIDRHVPLIWPMKRRGDRGISISSHHSLKNSSRRNLVTVKVHIVKYPERHEAFESSCIRLLSMPYEEAHHHAVRAEWSLVTTDGYDWDFYEKQWTPLIKADEVEKIERVPPDLDLSPYEGTPLHAILADKMLHFRHGARGKFHKRI
jgi:hypothetical protein